MKSKGGDFTWVVIVSVISIVCIAVFLLPPATQDLLKVRHIVFNPITYITASFVHDDLQHLGFNLSGFILFSFLLYFFNKKTGKQQFFFGSLLGMFVALPLLNYGLLFYSSIWKSMEFGYGLSLVDSGLIGFTVPSLILFFKARLRKFNSLLFFTSMFLFTACLVIAPYNLMLFVLCAILGFAFGMFGFRGIFGFLAESFKQRKKRMESFMVVFTLYFYFLSIVGLFPTSIVSQSGITDIISHFVGLLFGIVPFSFYNIRLSKTSREELSKNLRR